MMRAGRDAALAVLLSERDIERLMTEPKPLPSDWVQRLALKPKRGHREAQLDLAGLDGSEFKLILRQADANVFDFSAILAYCPPESNQVIRLCRCNGRHQHTNAIERDSFYDFHVHTATERYQELGADEEGFAIPCGEYTDLQGAIQVLCARCAIEVPASPQMSLEETDGWQ